jgi:restriction system protein
MVGSEFARWINPLLKALRELGGSARPREVVELVARNERVTDEVLDQINPAGGQRFPNQVHWARFYLAEGSLLKRELKLDSSMTTQLKPSSRRLLSALEIPKLPVQ